MMKGKNDKMILKNNSTNMYGFSPLPVGMSSTEVSLLEI